MFINKTTIQMYKTLYGKIINNQIFDTLRIIRKFWNIFEQFFF